MTRDGDPVPRPADGATDGAADARADRAGGERTGGFEAVVRGVVQGVGFRYFVRRHANRLGLSGWVANEPDGSVRCVASGPSDALDELLAVLHRGPPGSRVDDVAVTARPPAAGSDRGGDGFQVRASGHRGD